MQTVDKYFYISEVNVQKKKPYLQATSGSNNDHGIHSTPRALAAPCVLTIRFATKTPNTS